MKIQQWMVQDRPREKLILQGSEALTDAELLAIFSEQALLGVMQ